MTRADDAERAGSADASVAGFIIDAHGPRVGYAFAASCGAASTVTCLLGLRRLRLPSAAGSAVKAVQPAPR